MPVTRRSSKAMMKLAEADIVPLSASDDAMERPERRTSWFYVVLLFPVGFVWALPFIFCCMSLQHVYRYGQLSPLPHQHWFYKMIVWFGHLEVPFQIWLRYLHWQAQARKTYEPKPREFLSNVLLQCMAVGVPIEHPPGSRRPKQLKEPDWTQVNKQTVHLLRKKLRLWFINAPFSSLKADNVCEWLAWAVGNGMTLEEARQDAETAQAIEEALRIMQLRLRWIFPPGYNSGVKTMRLTLDPVKLAIRPLGYYCVTNLAMGLPAYLWLMGKHGFRLESRHGLQLLVKPPSDGPSEIAYPIVLLHALGVGVAHNRAFLKHIVKSKRGVVLLLQPNISTHIWHPRFLDPPSPEAHVAAVKETCDAHGIKQATVISQSNGTMVHGWMLRGAKELCYRNILVDAVSFKLFEGDLCYAFLHKKRNKAFHSILNYFVLRELGIAHSISRDFQWTDMSLWEHELPTVEPDRCRIIIGEQDSLIDSASIVDYLRECRVPDETVRVIKGCDHGISLIMDSPGMNEVLSMLR